MADEEVIIDIKIDSAEAVRNLQQAQSELAKLKDAEDNLNDSLNEGTISYDEYTKALGENLEAQQAQKDAIKANNDVIKQNAKENNAAKGSLTQMRAELKQMIKAYDNMSAEERKAADKGGALQKAIMEQTDAIKAAEYSTGRFQRNVGNYPKVFDIASTSLGRMLVGLNGFIGTAPGVKGATSAMSAGVKGLKVQLTQLLANPIVAVIAAVIIKIRMYIKLAEKVIDTIKSTDEGGTALAALMESFRPIMDVVNKAFGLLAKVLVEVVKGVTAAINAILGIIPAFKKSGDAAMEYVKTMDELEDADRRLTLQKAENAKVRSELELKMLNKEKYSAEEREKMAKDIEEMERKQLEQERKNEAIRIKLKEDEFLKEHGWQNKRGKERDEALNKLKDDQKDELVQMRAHYIELETEMNNHLRKVKSREQQAREEQRKAEEEALKKRREAWQKHLEKLATMADQELSHVRAMEDARLAIMEDGEEKERKAAELAYNRAVEDLGRQVEREKKAKTLTERAAEAVNQQLLDMKTAYEQQLLKITEDGIKKRQNKEKKAHEEETKRLKDQLKIEADAIKTAEALRDAQELQIAGENERKKLEVLAEQAQREYEQKAEEYQRLLELQNNYEEAGFKSYAEYVAAVNKANLDMIESDNKRSQRQKAIADYDKMVQEKKYKAIMGAVGGLQSLMETIGEDNENAAKAAKAIALAQVAIETGKSIAMAITAAMESASATGPAAAFTAPAFIAELVGIVLGGVTSAISTIKSAKFADGGLVRGAGTGTSDSINARLSNGESVMTAKATAMFYDTLSAMNVAGGGVAFPNSGNKTAFATGGVVSMEAVQQGRAAEEMARAIENVQPVVSVREITRVSNRVAVKERVSQS